MSELKRKLYEYKRKFYKNLLIKGSLISLAIILLAFLLFNVLEYSFRFGSEVRAILFFSFITVSLYLIIRYITDPLIRMYYRTKQISNEQAARHIGSFFPTVNDKLLNILQLEKLISEEGDLAQASVKQKSREIGTISFTEAINFKINIKYLKFFLPVVSIALIMIFAAPDVLKSSERIIHYKKEFIPEAPFDFNLKNDELLAFRNEDFTVNLGLNGKVIPESVYLVNQGRRIKLNKNKDEYQYTFGKIQRDEKFAFEAAGFSSKSFQIKVVDRPNLKNFMTDVEYPSYLIKENQRFTNTGNLEIPEGSTIRWQFNTIEADSLILLFENDEKESNLTRSNKEMFEHERQMFNSDNYVISLKNRYSDNKDKIRYHIEVIPDQYPVIILEQLTDTTFYNYIILGGSLADDHGLTDLRLFYKKTNESNENYPEKNVYESIKIPVDLTKNSQSYYYQWFLDSIKLNTGDNIEYFLQVKDNDGVNGPKASRTAVYQFKIPSKKELKEEIENSSAKSREQIEKNVQKARELNENIDKSIDRLKGKREMNWQDTKMINDLIQQKEDLENEIKKLQEQFKKEAEKRERFSEEKNKSIQEKVQQLQQLMDELLDEETKKLYEELQKLLDENKNLDDIKNQLEKLSNSEENLEKELARTLEMFKQMKFEFKLEDIINEAEELSEKQENLSQETTDKKSELEEIKEKQKELNQEQDDLKESIEELEEMNQDLKNPRPMQDMSEEQKGLEEEQKNTKDALEKGERKKAGESQKNMSQQMQQMAEKMQQMQMNMEMTMMQENLDFLRHIQNNLVRLSFSQEDLMNDFRKVNQSDPRFIELSQQQHKLKDDAQIIEDSLRSLADRVFQIRSFITREVDDMNNHMDESLDALKERKKNEAVGKQQFAMTSMNNLALLLSDVLQQMQQQMADAMGIPNKNNKNGDQQMPNMGELQKQLNEKINELKKSGKTGRELSEELAKLAAEQEMIRQALKEHQDKIDEKGKDGGDGVNELMEQMEDTELDLVNKQLTEKTIHRQQEILTRLLEAENSMRERELDEKREGEKAEEFERKVPPAFEEYIKMKEQEIELLKTVPLKMNPFYKNEISEYFKRLKDQNP
jgi:hypothetical protein